MRQGQRYGAAKKMEHGVLILQCCRRSFALGYLNRDLVEEAKYFRQGPLHAPRCSASLYSLKRSSETPAVCSCWLNWRAPDSPKSWAPAMTRNGACFHEPGFPNEPPCGKPRGIRWIDNRVSPSKYSKYIIAYRYESRTACNVL